MGCNGVKGVDGMKWGPCTYYVMPKGGGGVWPGVIICYIGGRGGQVKRYVTTCGLRSRSMAGLPLDILWITSVDF